MSLSKVIKNSGDFVPENIISKDLDDKPVWGQLVKRIEAEKNPPEQSNEGEATHGSVAAKTFESDFSAPDISSEDDGQPRVTIPPADLTGQAKLDHKYTQDELDAAVEDSYNSGVQAGLERMESDYGVSVKTLQSVCEQLNTIRETILKNSMSEMRELVILIAEKIIRHSITLQKDTIVRTVEDAIQQAVKSDEFIISVNPDDYITIKTKSADFINSVSGLENIIVKSDSTIDSGGCVVESSNCTVDATLVSQLEIISEALHEK